MTQARYQLQMQSGPDAGQIIDLESVSVTLGRDPMVDITINDPEVSRQHARLIQTLSGYQIQDLGSTNGTFVDGTRIGGEPVDLRSGQSIAMGSNVSLVYEVVTEDDEVLATMIDFVPPEEDSQATIQAAAGAAAAFAAADTGEEADVVEEAIVAAEVIESAEGEEVDVVVEAEVEAEPSAELEIAASELEEETGAGAAVDAWAVAEEAAPVEPESEAVTEVDFDVPDYESFLAAETGPGPVVEPEQEVLFTPPAPPTAEPEQIIEQVPPKQERGYAPPPREPQIIPGDGKETPKRNRTALIAGAVTLILLCCCCVFLVFMWSYGGDWLLRQAGMLP